jgi:hypothetical protein
LDTKFLKLQKNATDIKLILSRILPQLNFLIILNFEPFTNFPVFPENGKQETKSKKALTDFGPKEKNGPSPSPPHEN